MDKNDFLDLVEGAMIAAFETEQITLTEEEKSLMKIMLDRYGEQLQKSSLSPTQAMDELWNMWQSKVTEVKQNTSNGIYDGKLASVRLEQLTDILNRHWQEIRQCGNISSEGREAISKYKS
jgi:hypothetical protein